MYIKNIRKLVAFLETPVVDILLKFNITETRTYLHKISYSFSEH